MGGHNCGFNYNVDKISDNKREIRSMDGLVANSKITVSENYIVIRKYDPFGEGTYHYVDSNLDGEIDFIRQESPFFTLDYVVKDLHLSVANETEFVKANEEYDKLLEEYRIEL